jgi:hypothetical protein
MPIMDLMLNGFLMDFQSEGFHAFESAAKGSVMNHNYVMAFWNAGPFGQCLMGVD